MDKNDLDILLETLKCNILLSVFTKALLGCRKELENSNVPLSKIRNRIFTIYNKNREYLSRFVKGKTDIPSYFLSEYVSLERKEYIEKNGLEIISYIDPDDEEKIIKVCDALIENRTDDLKQYETADAVCMEVENNISAENEVASFSGNIRDHLNQIRTYLRSVPEADRFLYKCKLSEDIYRELMAAASRHICFSGLEMGAFILLLSSEWCKRNYRNYTWDPIFEIFKTTQLSSQNIGNFIINGCRYFGVRLYQSQNTGNNLYLSTVLINAGLPKLYMERLQGFLKETLARIKGYYVTKAQIVQDIKSASYSLYRDEFYDLMADLIISVNDFVKGLSEDYKKEPEKHITSEFKNSLPLYLNDGATETLIQALVKEAARKEKTTYSYPVCDFITERNDNKICVHSMVRFTKTSVQKDYFNQLFGVNDLPDSFSIMAEGDKLYEVAFVNKALGTDTFRIIPKKTSFDPFREEIVLTLRDTKFKSFYSNVVNGEQICSDTLLCFDIRDGEPAFIGSGNKKIFGNTVYLFIPDEAEVTISSNVNEERTDLMFCCSEENGISEKKLRLFKCGDNEGWVGISLPEDEYKVFLNSSPSQDVFIWGGAQEHQLEISSFGKIYLGKPTLYCMNNDALSTIPNEEIQWSRWKSSIPSIEVFGPSRAKYNGKSNLFFILPPNFKMTVNAYSSNEGSILFENFCLEDIALPENEAYEVNFKRHENASVELICTRKRNSSIRWFEVHAKVYGEWFNIKLPFPINEFVFYNIDEDTDESVDKNKTPAVCCSKLAREILKISTCDQNQTYILTIRLERQNKIPERLINIPSGFQEIPLSSFKKDISLFLKNAAENDCVLLILSRNGHTEAQCKVYNFDCHLEKDIVSGELTTRKRYQNHELVAQDCYSAESFPIEKKSLLSLEEKDSIYLIKIKDTSVTCAPFFVGKTDNKMKDFIKGGEDASFVAELANNFDSDDWNIVDVWLNLSEDYPLYTLPFMKELKRNKLFFASLFVKYPTDRLELFISKLSNDLNFDATLIPIEDWKVALRSLIKTKSMGKLKETSKDVFNTLLKKQISDLCDEFPLLKTLFIKIVFEIEDLRFLISDFMPSFEGIPKFNSLDFWAFFRCGEDRQSFQSRHSFDEIMVPRKNIEQWLHAINFNFRYEDNILTSLIYAPFIVAYAQVKCTLFALPCSFEEDIYELRSFDEEWFEKAFIWTMTALIKG